MEIKTQPVYYVVFCTTKYGSFEDAKMNAPDDIAAHMKRSHQLHEKGTLLMSGAFIENEGEPLSTMGVLTSREAAEEYIKGDPFVLKGMVSNWHIREWANMFAA
ncbi:MAG TPA: YciI family protein [Ktedonobacteraceae bacterium]|nr:YciI family protein [Ktedonobacteraceae bacterium]